jgi:hypothetical protein
MSDRNSEAQVAHVHPMADPDEISTAENAAAAHDSEAERARHERFHQAVRQFLPNTHLQGVALPPKNAGGSYARLLSAQELRFLLR